MCFQLGYSERSKGFKVYNIETKIVEDSIHVKFDDKHDSEESKQVEKFTDLEIIYSNSECKNSEDKDFGSSQHETDQSEPEPADTPTPQRNYKQIFSHPEDLILGDNTNFMRTKSSFRKDEEMFLGLVSVTELTSIDEVMLDT